ncbi:hypothetical protein MMC25_004940 [Agyrium rufum]|nr:hypothetical protein [Agyrium rufum]
MATPPFRSRPNLHLSFTPPSSHSTPCPSSRSPFLSAADLTPLGSTRYSPFRSASLKTPSSYDGIGLANSKLDSPSGSFGRHRRRYVWYRLQRALTSRVAFGLLCFVLMLVWWGGRWRDEVVIFGEQIEAQLFQAEATKGLQFVPAVHPGIHYVGRWTSTPNRQRKDGTFSGAYFDFEVSNTTTIILSLYNAPPASPSTSITNRDMQETVIRIINPAHLSFRPTSQMDNPAKPVSLIARIDEDDYIVFPNASSLIAVSSGELERNATHKIRVIAPMTDDDGLGLVQMHGLWIERFAKIKVPDGLQDDEDYGLGDFLDAEGGFNVRRDAKLDETPFSSSNNANAFSNPVLVVPRKKLLEIVTDNPGSISQSMTGQHIHGLEEIVTGVMSWDNLLGEMFGVDHTSVSIDGMCLTEGCIGGRGSPAGIGDAFFRSGPPSTPYFEHPWFFHSSIPDIMVLNLGMSDSVSFDNHANEYNQTAWEFSEAFEEAYVSLVHGIRRLAYPKHPSLIYHEKKGDKSYISHMVPAAIPIFIMRPLRGQMEHATQGAVNRLRADGDKSVFWIDTSGWLEVSDDPATAQDFFYDQTTLPPKWRLTAQGNQRVAIFLHVHVCRYLASDPENCAFLAPDVYSGQGQDPDMAGLDDYLDGEKERRLKEMFWGIEDGAKDSVVV